ncbi:hypothetical protein K488DRAFT_41101 [Vararia minispora EC-137]|uniref:Uncharacterized protein n=1 Tax=Vararia minispora EC-137 TaxID=1314806 RepID=A0ACB8QXY0_9AGAM|nr:hypothetical protein K488DRAFT_41101 [Vararia minispora EC-137]
MLSFAFAATVTRGIFQSPSRFFSSSTVLEFPKSYKLKSHSGTKKRWRGLPNGLFKRGKAYHHHLNVTKRPGRKNKLGLTAYSNSSQTPRLKKLLPYAN